MAQTHPIRFPRIGASREMTLSHAYVDPARNEPDSGGPELALTEWFSARYGFLSPSLTQDQRFSPDWDHLFEDVELARDRGQAVDPVVIGPLTYLWFCQVNDDSFNKLDLLERLLPLYGKILKRLADQGVEWVQIDEPVLCLQLPQEWKSGFERAYHILQYSPLKKLVATCFGTLNDNLGLAAALPVDGLHIDAVREPERLVSVLDRVPPYKVLSLGAGSGCEVWQSDLDVAALTLDLARERFGNNLWIAGSTARC